MSLDFYKRFNLKVDEKETRRRFVNRAQNLIFNGLLYKYDDYDRISREIASTLGERYTFRTNPENYIQGDFQRTLTAIEAFYSAMPYSNAPLNSLVMRLLSESEVHLSIRWMNGEFFPEGAPILDERLVNNILGWIRAADYKSVLEPFEKGLMHLLDSKERPELLVDVITDMYEALESLSKIVTERPNNDLSSNQELFLKKVKASDHYKRILKQYVEYAHNFRHGASKTPRAKIERKEAESFVYLTGLFLRMAMPSS